MLNFCLNADYFLSEICMVFSRFTIEPNNPAMFFASGMETTNSRKLKIKIIPVSLKLKELQFMEKFRKVHLIFT